MEEQELNSELSELAEVCKKYHCQKCGASLVPNFKVLGYIRKTGGEFIGGVLRCPNDKLWNFGHDTLWVEGELACQYRVWCGSKLVARS